MEPLTEPEVLPPGKSLPLGTKQVRVNRTETYQEPIQAAPDVDPSPANDTDPQEDPDPSPLQYIAEDDEPTALDQLLDSLQEESADVVIYIKRKSDPIQCTFKRPYTGPPRTVGELSFDDSFTTQMAVELMAQRIYGGGYYQFQIYRRGQNRYVRGWSSVVDDPVEKTEPQKTVAPAEPAPLPDNSFQSFATQAREFAETAKALGLGPSRSRSNDDDARQLQPPPDPVEAFRGNVAMMKGVVDVFKELRPESEPSAAGADRSAVRDVLDISKELGIGETVREFMRPLAGIAGAMLAQSLREKQIQAAQQARARAGGGQQPPPQYQPNPREMAGTVGAPPPNVPRETLPVEEVQIPVDETNAIPDEAIALLATVVDDMREGTDESLDRAVTRVAAILKFRPDAQPFVDDLLRKSGFEIVGWLGTVKPEWKLLPTLKEAGEFVSWCEDFRQEMRTELSGEETEPAAPAEPATIDLSRLATAGDAVAPPAPDVPRETSVPVGTPTSEAAPKPAASKRKTAKN
jgi:hypothetical protein